MENLKKILNTLDNVDSAEYDEVEIKVMENLIKEFEAGIRLGSSEIEIPKEYEITIKVLRDYIAVKRFLVALEKGIIPPPTKCKIEKL